MDEGIILKALSGFYYVYDGTGDLVTCRARGKFRHQKITPLVGDRVRFTRLSGSEGALDEIFPRKNQFQRPAVANIDQLVIVVSGAIPITDPFLIDRVAAIADNKEGCESLICINKCDLDAADMLYQIYTAAGFHTLRVSAETGEGIQELSAAIAGKVSAFTGNSGVGKSSLLNCLDASLRLPTGEISGKLGRGRHTTRQSEIFHLANGLVADTPGFSALDLEKSEVIRKEELPFCFPEFLPYLGHCQFTSCTHTKDKGCAILQALADGEIEPKRHESYVAFYESVKDLKDWETG